MPDVTTQQCRDGWSDHATTATDLMNEALGEIQKAQLHLEPDWKDRLSPLIEKQRRLCGRALQVFMAINNLRETALGVDRDKKVSVPA